MPVVSSWQGMLATTQIWPTVPFPFVIPFTVQATALLAVPNFVESLLLVAVICTVRANGRSAGAV